MYRTHCCETNVMEEVKMGLFDVTEGFLQAAYKRAWYACGRGFVDSRKYPELDRALTQFAIQNNCSYDEAYLLAKTGKRFGRLANKK